MTRAWAIVIALSGACADAPSPSADTGVEQAPGADTPDPCAQVGGGSGGHDETIDCADGRCRVSAERAWLGAATDDHPERCPVHEVTISPFDIDQYEVTSAAYTACADADACPPPDDHCAVGDDHPITCVDHDAATAYCTWAGGRLPTEAEWELAARGSDQAVWPWVDLAPTCNHANFRFVSSYCVGDTLEVGSLPRGDSPFGVADMSGNVWEWVADWYDAEAYRYRAAVDPAGPDADCTTTVGDTRGACTQRVLRGGAWNTTEDTLSPAARSHAPPTLSDVNVGFRCAYDDLGQATR